MMASHLLLAAALTFSTSAPASEAAAVAATTVTQGSNTSPRVFLNAFARCLARARPDAARAVVNLPTASREQMAAAAGILNGDDGCGGAREFELPGGGLTLVGGLAEALLAAEPQSRSVVALASWNDDAIGRSLLRPRNGNEDMGICVVRRAPQQTASLLATTPDTLAETRAIQALVQHLGPCAPAGATMAFDKPTIRAQLAIALYRAGSFLRTAPATASIAPSRN